MLMVNALNPTSSPTVTITKDTIQPSKPASVLLELNILEENALPSPLAQIMLTTMVLLVFVTVVLSSIMELVFQPMLLFLPALIMLTSMVFHALAAQASINQVLELVPLVLLELHGTDKLAPQLSVLLALQDTSSTLPLAFVSHLPHHAEIMPLGMVLFAAALLDTT